MQVKSFKHTPTLMKSLSILKLLFLIFHGKKNVLSNVKACFKTTVFYINMNNNRNITCTNFVDVNIDLNLHSNEEN